MQACRYLSERLVEAVGDAERQLTGRSGPGVRITPEGSRHGDPGETLPDRRRGATDLARRLVADRCLYGVDKNPLAVEMAKLSLWLITLDKDRPFTFLDHALKCGDSLVGVDLDQLRTWNLEGSGERRFEHRGPGPRHRADDRAAPRDRGPCPCWTSATSRPRAQAGPGRGPGPRPEAGGRHADRQLLTTRYKRDQQATLRSASLSVAAMRATSLDERWHEHADLVDPSAVDK